jgi:hypothetical protein
MSCVKKLKAALAAVPVGEPCTAAAVEVIYVSAHAASRQLSPTDRRQAPADNLVEACAQQQLPRACMPVLAWLAAGLRSGLPPAATEQAHELACALLEVASRVLPDAALQNLSTSGAASSRSTSAAQKAVQKLGSFGRLLPECDREGLPDLNSACAHVVYNSRPASRASAFEPC